VARVVEEHGGALAVCLGGDRQLVFVERRGDLLIEVGGLVELARFGEPPRLRPAPDR
jgi:hypothetical protein